MPTKKEEKAKTFSFFPERSRCLIWHGLGPDDCDGQGLFEDEGGYFVYSCTPSVEKRNRLEEKEAKAYAKKLCSEENYSLLFGSEKKEYMVFVGRLAGETREALIRL